LFHTSQQYGDKYTYNFIPSKGFYDFLWIILFCRQENGFLLIIVMIFCLIVENIVYICTSVENRAITAIHINQNENEDITA